MSLERDKAKAEKLKKDISVLKAKLQALQEKKKEQLKKLEEIEAEIERLSNSPVTYYGYGGCLPAGSEHSYTIDDDDDYEEERRRRHEEDDEEIRRINEEFYDNLTEEQAIRLYEEQREREAREEERRRKKLEELNKASMGW